MAHLPAIATAVAVVGVIAVVLWQVHLNLLLSNTTTTGGDTGAHFAMPAFIRSNLLSHGRITGWDPSWYDGYPIYTFYFVLPDLITAIGSFLAPYDIVFKLVTMLGSVTLPVAAWALGRWFRLRPPIPAALAAATLPFLFDYTWTIDGGNLFSTLAGEYAFSLSLTLALVFIGLFARGLRTGRGRAWSSFVLALCILAHIVPAFLAIGGAVVLMAFELVPERFGLHDDRSLFESEHPPRQFSHAADQLAVQSRRPLRWGCSTLAIGVLLSGWWLVPFGALHSYSTQMGYQNVGAVPVLFPSADLWVLVLAAIALLAAGLLRSRFGLLFGILGGASAIGLSFDPQGSLYNARLIPLWFICVYLMAGWLFGTVVLAGANAWRNAGARRRAADEAAALALRAVENHGVENDGVDEVPQETEPEERSGVPARSYRFRPAAVTGPIVAILAACLVVVPPFILPAGALPSAPGANQVSYWSSWNYTGYEGKAAYPEFHAVLQTMEDVGHQDGCGRSMWEYNADENRFGTPEALMLLPYFTNGCIDSMEGLLFESSTTTPYHFLNQSELSDAPSDPMVGLPYSGLDVPLGVEHLQLLGVRYFMAFTPAVVNAAKADPSLRLVAKTGPWRSVYGASLVTTTWYVFEVRSAPLVSPLSAQPAVLRGVGAGQSSWLPISTTWYDTPSSWRVELAAGGPKAWPRVTKAQAGRPPLRPVRVARVTHIVTTTDTISFRVDHTGTPILVKTSYFPDWHATGAQGPWRVTPNSMVVVPTAHTVTLTYTTSSSQELGRAASGFGLAALVALGAGAWWRRRRRPVVPTQVAGGTPGGPEPLG
jgi:hypothetical protein